MDYAESNIILKVIRTSLHTLAITLWIPGSKHVTTRINLVHLTPLVRLRLFDVLGRIDQYHIFLSSWWCLLLSIYCIIFRIHKWIMILGGVLREELLISASDVCVTLRQWYSSTKTQIRIIALLHPESLMTWNITLFLNRVLIGNIYAVSWLAQATDDLVHVLRIRRNVDHAVDASGLHSVVTLSLKIISPVHLGPNSLPTATQNLSVVVARWSNPEVRLAIVILSHWNLLLNRIHMVNLGLPEARLISCLSLNLCIWQRATLCVDSLIDRSCLRTIISKGVFVETLMRLIWQPVILKWYLVPRLRLWTWRITLATTLWKLMSSMTCVGLVLESAAKTSADLSYYATRNPFIIKIVPSILILRSIGRSFLILRGPLLLDGLHLSLGIRILNDVVLILIWVVARKLGIPRSWCGPIVRS
jgi:hypothetical protein